VKKLSSARLAREPSTWTCNRLIIYRCYITYLSIKHTYITYLFIKHIKHQANNEIEYELDNIPPRPQTLKDLMKNEFHVYEAYSSTPNLHYYLRLRPWPRLSTST
jgi:hypothetical protein